MNNVKLVKEIWQYDTMRNNILKSKGYMIYTIWENDFKNNKNKVLEKIKKIYE